MYLGCQMSLLSLLYFCTAPSRFISFSRSLISLADCLASGRRRRHGGSPPDQPAPASEREHCLPRQALPPNRVSASPCPLRPWHLAEPGPSWAGSVAPGWGRRLERSPLSNPRPGFLGKTWDDAREYSIVQYHYKGPRHCCGWQVDVLVVLFFIFMCGWINILFANKCQSTLSPQKRSVEML